MISPASAVSPSDLEIAAREGGQRGCADEKEIRDCPDADRPAVDEAASKRAELEQEAGRPGRVAGDQTEAVLVQPLERERPGCDRRGVPDLLRVERVPDRPEQPGDEPGAE